MAEVCKACEVINNDKSKKEGAEWCGLCKAFLCPSCQKNPARRIKAASIIAFRNLKSK